MPSPATIFFIIATLATGPLVADTASLIDNSPFVPESMKNRRPEAPAPVQQEAPPSNLEFTGFYEMNGQRYFSIVDTQAQRNSWIRDGDESGDTGFVFTNFNPDTMTLSVQHLGQPYNMTLRQRSAPSGTMPTSPAGGSQTVRPANPSAPGAGNSNNARRVVIPRRR